MARSAALAPGGSGAVKGVAAVVVVLVLTVVVLLLVRARPAPEPFDPTSGRDDGARGLALTLAEAGAEVTDTRTVPSTRRIAETRLLVLDDRLDPEQRSDLLDFVEAGGIAIVADPESSLHGGSGVDGGAASVFAQTRAGIPRRPAENEANVLVGVCDIGALQQLRGIFVPDGVLFPVGGDEPRCFTDARRSDGAEPVSFVIVREVGAGLIVGLGDNEPFTNVHLRQADNAALAVSLLVPAQGAGVTIVVGSGATTSVQDVGSGDDTLIDLVPGWVWMTLVVAGLSFLLFAVSQSIRLGRVVSEPLPTPIAASELVEATGNLMQRAGHASRAAWLLRDRYHRDLSAAHGLPLVAPLAELDRIVAQRSGTVPGEIEQLLRAEARDEAGLTRIAAAIHASRARTLPDSADAPAPTLDTATVGATSTPHDDVSNTERPATP